MVCPFCREEFLDATLYRQHSQQDDHVNSYPHAKIAFSQYQYAKVDITDLKCRICDKKFDHLKTIAEHLRDEHKIDIEPSSLHIQPYKIEKGKFACGVCDQQFVGIHHVGKHMTSHFLTCTCSICGKSFWNEDTLRLHNKFVHAPKKYPCRKCLKCFDTAEERNKHVDDNRTCWYHSCTICPERFRTPKQQKTHLANVHGQTLKKFLCHCGEEFRSNMVYKEHCNKVHGVENFACTTCGMRLGSKRALDLHMVVHTKERNFHCTVCSKSFYRQSNLNAHSWLHRELKRFTCKVCTKTFNQRACYVGHMKAHHPGEEI